MNGNSAGILAIAMWSVANLLVTFTGAVPAFQLGAMVMVPSGIIISLIQVLKGARVKNSLQQPLYAYLS